MLKRCQKLRFLDDIVHFGLTNFMIKKYFLQGNDIRELTRGLRHPERSAVRRSKSTRFQVLTLLHILHDIFVDLHFRILAQPCQVYRAETSFSQLFQNL